MSKAFTHSPSYHTLMGSKACNTTFKINVKQWLLRKYYENQYVVRWAHIPPRLKVNESSNASHVSRTSVSDHIHTDYVSLVVFSFMDGLFLIHTPK